MGCAVAVTVADCQHSSTTDVQIDPPANTHTTHVRFPPTHIHRQQQQHSRFLLRSLGRAHPHRAGVAVDQEGHGSLCGPGGAEADQHVGVRPHQHCRHHAHSPRHEHHATPHRPGCVGRDLRACLRRSGCTAHGLPDALAWCVWVCVCMRACVCVCNARADAGVDGLLFLQRRHHPAWTHTSRRHCQSTTCSETSRSSTPTSVGPTAWRTTRSARTPPCRRRRDSSRSGCKTALASTLPPLSWRFVYMCLHTYAATRRLCVDWPIGCTTCVQRSKNFLLKCPRRLQEHQQQKQNNAMPKSKRRVHTTPLLSVAASPPTSAKKNPPHVHIHLLHNH